LTQAFRLLLAPALASAGLSPQEGKSTVLLSTKLQSQDEADPSKRFPRLPVTVNMALSKMDSDFDELDSKENEKEESRLAVAKLAAEKVKNFNLGEKIQTQIVAASEQIKAEKKSVDEIQADLNMQKADHEKAAARLKHRLDRRTTKLKAAVEQKKVDVAAKQKILQDAEKKQKDLGNEIDENMASIKVDQKDVQTFQAEVQEKEKAFEVSQKQLRVARHRANVAAVALEAGKREVAGLKAEVEEREKQVSHAQTAALTTEVSWKEHVAEQEKTDSLKAETLVKDQAAAKEAEEKAEKVLEEHGTLLLQAQKKQKQLKEEYSEKKAEELQATSFFEDRRREAEAGEVSEGDWAWSKKA